MTTYEYGVWWNEQPQPGTKPNPKTLQGIQDEGEAHRLFRALLAEPDLLDVQLWRRRIGEWEQVVPRPAGVAHS